MSYSVIGPLAVLTDSTGKIQYFYNGAAVPDGFPEKEIDKALRRGLISEVDADGLPVQRDGNDEAPAPEVELDRPSLVASKELWVDYATKRGMSRERAESLSKREIIDSYPVGS